MQQQKHRMHFFHTGKKHSGEIPTAKLRASPVTTSSANRPCHPPVSEAFAGFAMMRLYQLVQHLPEV